MPNIDSEAERTSKKRDSIAAYSARRDNNFNLIRVVASLLVILTHAYGLTGSAQHEPLKGLFGISFGSWAVDIFFSLSGFLVCKSWHMQPSVRRFLLARAARIYPALWVCVALCAFGIGLVFTVLPWASYLTHIDTLKFVVANSTLLPKGVFTTLPGVFSGASVNSPLWTLPYELRMYLLLLLIGWSGQLFRTGVLITIVVASLVGFGWGALGGHHEDTIPENCRFIFCFWAGVFFYAMRERVALLSSAAAGLVALLLVSTVTLPIEWRLLFLTIATPYLSLYLAFVPSGSIRAYNRLGDYSYGLYIYGTAVQMVLLETVDTTMGVVGNFMSTACISLVLAFLSWHLLESKALKWKKPHGAANPAVVDVGHAG